MESFLLASFMMPDLIHTGLLGIGGGMIVNPLLLEFGTHPHVAAATSTLMVRTASYLAAVDANAVCMFESCLHSPSKYCSSPHQ